MNSSSQPESVEEEDLPCPLPGEQTSRGAKRDRRPKQAPESIILDRGGPTLWPLFFLIGFAFLLSLMQLFAVTIRVLNIYQYCCEMVDQVFPSTGEEPEEEASESDEALVRF